MKTIIVEETVYLVTDKEYKFLAEKAEEIKKADWPLCEDKQEDLMLYLDKAKLKYKKVGVVMFDTRR